MKKKYAGQNVDELWSNKSVSLGVWDSANYYVGSITTIGKGKEAGKDKLTDLSYFGSLAQAVKHICERRAKRARNADLKDFLANYRKAQAELEEAIGI